MQCVDLHGCLPDPEHKAGFLEKFTRISGKTYKDSSLYYDTFLTRYTELDTTVALRVAQGNLRATKAGRVKQLLRFKSERIGGRVPWVPICFSYQQNLTLQKCGKLFLEEIHNSLLYLLNKHQYGNWGLIVREFRRLRIFQFNSVAQAITEAEIERWCGYVVRVIEKEVQKIQVKRMQLEQVRILANRSCTSSESLWHWGRCKFRALCITS